MKETLEAVSGHASSAQARKIQFNLNNKFRRRKIKMRYTSWERLMTVGYIATINLCPEIFVFHSLSWFLVRASTARARWATLITKLDPIKWIIKSN